MSAAPCVLRVGVGRLRTGCSIKIALGQTTPRRKAGAVAEWAFFGERRMITDAALYIPLTYKSEEIANK